MTIAIDENIPLLADALAVCASVRTFAAHELTRSDIRDVDALIVRSKTRVGASLLHGTPVRFVGTATAGTDHINSAYLREQGIQEAQAAGCNAMSVAEYVLYAALQWNALVGQELRGKTIGIIGFGNVGKRVAHIARCLSMQVLLNDPPLAEKGYQFPADCQYVDVGTLVATADIVTLHVPLVREGSFPTVSLLSPVLLQQMREGALVVQASRGGIVHEQALLPLLAAKRLYAAFDVWEHEPLANSALAQHCLLATPHIAGYSWEGKVRGAAMIAHAFAAWSGLQPHMDAFAQPQHEPAAIAWNDEAALLRHLQHTRCFHNDDCAFRASLALPSDTHANEFHALRKHYPVRHESIPDIVV